MRPYALGSNLSAAEFMQKRCPVGAGPSSKTWPRCASHAAHSTSVRRMNMLRSCSVRTFSLEIGAVKLGQPVPESNFVSELNRGVPQQTQRYVPGAWLSQYSPLNGGSVPFLRATLYCCDVSCARHSSSDFVTL